MSKARIVDRIEFSAEGLTAGRKLQNTLAVRMFFARRGRKQYPRKSNVTFGYVPWRFPSLQYTILVFVGCSSSRHSARRA